MGDEVKKKIEKKLLFFSSKKTDKKERENAMKVATEIKDRPFLNETDIQKFFKFTNASLLHYDELFEFFLSARVEQKAYKEDPARVMNVIVSRITKDYDDTDEYDGERMVAVRALELLIGEQNPYQDEHRLLLTQTNIVQALIPKLKAKKTPNEALLFSFLRIIYFIIMVPDDVGLDIVFKAGGLDRMIMLLQEDHEEMIELQVVKILAVFFRKSEYKILIEKKSDLSYLKTMMQEDMKGSEDKSKVLGTSNGSNGSPLSPSKDKSSPRTTGILHQMERVRFNSFTFCKFCSDFIWGVSGKQGYACSVCGYATHKRCKDKVPASCLPRMPNNGYRKFSNSSPSILTSSTDVNENKDDDMNDIGKTERSSSSASVTPPSSHKSDVNITTTSPMSGTRTRSTFSFKNQGAVEVITTLAKYASEGRISIHTEISRKDIIIEDEDLDMPVYKSPLCVVYKAKWKGQQVAVKQFDVMSLSFNWDDFHKEVALLSVINHPKVASFYGACSKGENPFLVSPYFQRGSLKQLCLDQRNRKEKVNYPVVMLIALDTANALKFLHSKHIIHRDVKPANFLVTDHFECKVIDFGVSRVVAQQDLKMTRIGTPVWMAPEVMKDEKYTEKADVYSYGLVLYELATQKPPYAGISSFDIPRIVSIEQNRPEIPPDVIPDMAVLIKRCWDADPTTRPSFAEIIDLIHEIKDPRTGEKFMDRYQRLSEAAFTKLFDHLEVVDMYNASLVCKGWYLVIRSHMQEVGLKPSISPVKSLKLSTDKWKVSFVRRHEEFAPKNHNVNKTVNNFNSNVNNGNVNKSEKKLKISSSSSEDHVVRDAVNKTLGSGNQADKRDKALKCYEKELFKLKEMLEEQKRANAELLKFKAKYEEQAKRRIEKKSKSMAHFSNVSHM